MGEDGFVLDDSCHVGVHFLAFDEVLHLVVVFGHNTSGGFAGLDGFGKFGGFTDCFIGGLRCV